MLRLGGFGMADGNTTAKPRRTRRAAGPTTPDPIEIAMVAAQSGVEPQGVAHMVLAKQAVLLDADLKHRQWQIAGERAGFALKVLTALAGIVFAAALGAMAWRASEAGGLVVEAFVVPPSMAADGLTGEVMARGVLDSLAQLDRETNSIFETKVTDSWSNNTKISLAQTGVSVDDLDRLLRRWLGDETYVQGEVVRTPAGVRLTARAAAGAPASVEGPVEALPALTQQLAEQLYRTARPNGYAELLMRRGQPQAAGPILQRLLATEDRLHDRTLAHALYALVLQQRGDAQEAKAQAEAATKSPDPTLAAIANYTLANLEIEQGRSNGQDRYQARALAIVKKHQRRIGELRRGTFEINRLLDERDYAAAERVARQLIDRRVPGREPGMGRLSYADILAYRHEVSAAKRFAPWLTPPVLHANDDWEGIVASTDAAPPWVQALPVAAGLKGIALAKLGRTEEAAAVLAGLPADCDVCRAGDGVLLAARGNVRGSEAAFDKMVRLAPNFPELFVVRGRERVARGDLKGALADFETAHKLAPRWPDPQAFWGEALLAQGDPQGASARFAEAMKGAPRWGRLHLKWGEALAAQGKTDEARAKWRAAAGMDLTAAERARVRALLQQRTS